MRKNRFLVKMLAISSLTTLLMVPHVWAESTIQMSAKPTPTITVTPINQMIMDPINKTGQQLNNQVNQSIDKTGQSIRSIGANATTGTAVSTTNPTDTSRSFNWSWLGLLGLVGLFGLFKPNHSTNPR